MKIQNMQVGFMGVNCYIVISDNHHAAVIDPGADADGILELLKESGASLNKILLTHGHFDHVGAVKKLKRETGAQVYIHEKDAYRLKKINVSSELLMDPDVSAADYVDIPADVIMKDGDIIELDDLSFQVVHTPGHSQGSVTFVLAKNLFTGDTLFYQEVGRTDLEGGNYNQLLNSIKNLMDFPDDYSVLPGHGQFSIIGHERKYNPYVEKALS